MQSAETIDLENYLSAKSKLVSECLAALVPEINAPYHQLFKAARYSLLNGGKRIRPILALAVCEAMNGSIENALKPVCTLEMVHTYSMIHDDLPCIDNDDFRRGVPTLHKVFPESHALLAGDFLLTQAFIQLSEDEFLTDGQKINLIRILSKSIGGEGMIAGQIMDIEAEKKEIRLSDLSEIHDRKTAALIEASILFGAILANAAESEKEILSRFGKKIGLAFQIVDDILDVVSSENKHGNSVSSDIKNGKKTYVSLIGINRSKEAVSQLMESALNDLKTLPFNTHILSKLARFVADRKL